jgi:aldehyde dehydrogenase (NAD+)
MQTTILDQLPGLHADNPGVGTGMQWHRPTQFIESFSPIDGRLLGRVAVASQDDYTWVMNEATHAFRTWRQVPAPQRGEIVRQIGNAFRRHKESLGALISWEMGKSLQEGKGEVQEVIDICDFAVGLSRQLYGLVMPSERPMHQLREQYHPLGVVGIITAFNFPAAVWAWNSALAWVCGNVCVWKPSSKTPLTAVACQQIVAGVLHNNNISEGVSCLLVSNRIIANQLVEDTRVPLISATGSVPMGRQIAVTVANRLGRSLLELGGNNAVILSQHADLNQAITAIVFGAIGTAGQRCTSTRRLIVHESIETEVKSRLQKAYAQLRIGDPLHEYNHLGPLIDQAAVKDYEKALRKAAEQGAEVWVEGGVLSGAGYESGCYVKPCVLRVAEQVPVVHEETFAPVLYVLTYRDLNEAIALQNAVPQGLSSSIMSLHLREVETFLSAAGSDCGIANVNTGTSGAEIGGAFGGEKETGGGRESGSDAWKAYMRRQTNAVNFGSDLPLAQGIVFSVTD